MQIAIDKTTKIAYYYGNLTLDAEKLTELNNNINNEFTTANCDLIEITPSNAPLRWLCGNLIYNGTTFDLTPEGETIILNEIINQKKENTIHTFNETINSLKLNYTDNEISSWDQQKLEAEAYVADNTVATPLLSKIATARGITVDLLATNIMVKVGAFQDAFGTALGAKQKAEDAIQVIVQDNTLTNQEKIDALNLL